MSSARSREGGVRCATRATRASLAGATSAASARSCCSPAISTRCPRRRTGPGQLDAEQVEGLGASDMKGGVAVMLELALRAGARGRAPMSAICCSGARSCRPRESALAPLLEREKGLRERRPRDHARADRKRRAGRLPRQPRRDMDASTGAPATRRDRGSPTMRSTVHLRAFGELHARGPERDAIDGPRVHAGRDRHDAARRYRAQRDPGHGHG